MKRPTSPVPQPPLEPLPRPEPPARPTPRPSRVEPEMGSGCGPGTPLEPFDPLARALALPVSRGFEPSAPTPAAPAPTLALPDELALERLVRRFSWGGNGKRGSARIELGSGPLAGATLVVHAEGREVSIEVEGGEDHAVGELARRVKARLDGKGLVLRDVSQR
ncbi:MAG: hypothetical protein HYZ29_09545 [Myxococcales bacterium]|nr:hypothetical protein [Myxococcales bacterium]